MRTGEDWPETRHLKGSCGCDRCRLRERALVERLSDRSLSAALAHAQNRWESSGAEAAPTKEYEIPRLGKFQGWTHPVTVDEILHKTMPGAPGMIYNMGRMRLYRIYLKGHENDPFYIGAAFTSTIKERVKSHMKGLFTASGSLQTTPEVRALQGISSNVFSKLGSEIKKLRVRVAQAPGVAQAPVVAKALGGAKKIIFAKAPGVVKASGVPKAPRGAKKIMVTQGKVMAESGKVDRKLLHAFELALQIIEKPVSYVGTVYTFEEEEEDDWF